MHKHIEEISDTLYRAEFSVTEKPSDDLVIDETNFSQYFHDVRNRRPQPGEVMARYSAMAEFVDDQLKRDVVYLLVNHNKGGDSAHKVMRKLAGATEAESIRLLKEMAMDLLGGLSEDEVCEKPYPYKCEF